jgi:hypothetical protein
MTSLTLENFAEIELAASKAMRKWERGYACQDINVRHCISWWIMEEAYARGKKDVLDAITYTDSEGGIFNSKLDHVDLREYLP